MKLVLDMFKNNENFIQKSFLEKKLCNRINVTFFLKIAPI